MVLSVAECLVPWAELLACLLVLWAMVALSPWLCLVRCKVEILQYLLVKE